MSIYDSYFQSVFSDSRLCNFEPYKAGSNCHRFESNVPEIWYTMWFRGSGKQREAFAGLLMFHQRRRAVGLSDIYNNLERRKEEIHSVVGQKLLWDQSDPRIQDPYLSIGLSRVVDYELSEFQKIKDWHIEMLVKLREVFRSEIEMARLYLRR